METTVPRSNSDASKFPPCGSRSRRYRPYLEMQVNEAHDEAFEVLREVVQDGQPLGIRRVLDVDQAHDLGASEGDVLVPDLDL